MDVQVYSNGKLDRASLYRETTESVLSNRRSYIAVWNGQFFFEVYEGTSQLKSNIPTTWVDSSTNTIFLGIMADIEWYCIDVSHISLNKEEKNQLQDIRKMFSLLDKEVAALLVYAKGITQWHRTHLFCGSCGSETMSQLKGHSRNCQNENCTHITYPRIDPSIITLIEYKSENKPAMCLLNRRKTENGYMCSTLAGFVEIGESLENAVVREMKEEVNVNIENIRYIASQPWPFPASLMIGFFAETKKLDFKVDNKEIKDAKWYTAQEIEILVAQGKLELSRDDSIAQTLIKKWLKDNNE